jgi:hypothetical protein
MLETFSTRLAAVLLNGPLLSGYFYRPAVLISASTVGDLIFAMYAQSPYSAALAFLMSQSPTQPPVRTVEKLRLKLTIDRLDG